MVSEAIAFVGLDDYRRFRPGKLSGGLLRQTQHRLRHRAQARPHLLRRADRGRGPAKPQRHPGGHHDPARPRHHRRVHQPLHGGGRADLRPDPHHGPRPASGARHRRGTQTHDRHRRAHHRPDPWTSPRPPLEQVDALPAVIAATYDGQQLDIRCRRGETNLIDILGVLERSGTNIGHLTSRPPSLNDVFLELTGTALRD